MENIAEKLQALLSDCEGLKQIRSLCDLLSDGRTAEKSECTSAEDISEEESIADTNDACAGEDDGQGMGADINMIFRLQSLFGAGDSENKNTALLNALKPHLAPERQEKVDKAVKIINLLEAVSVLKETGLLNDII